MLWLVRQRLWCGLYEMFAGFRSPGSALILAIDGHARFFVGSMFLFLFLDLVGSVDRLDLVSVA